MFDCLFYFYAGWYLKRTCGSCDEASYWSQQWSQEVFNVEVLSFHSIFMLFWMLNDIIRFAILWWILWFVLNRCCVWWILWFCWTDDGCMYRFRNFTVYMELIYSLDLEILQYWLFVGCMFCFCSLSWNFVFFTIYFILFMCLFYIIEILWFFRFVFTV